MATLPTLITETRKRGAATAGAGWSANLDGDNVVRIRHYGCEMLHVSAWDSVRAIDPGRGSVSDVQGINRMLEGIGSPERYRSLFKS
jgi:hypothetical protein